jgi:hypothetical protein
MPTHSIVAGVLLLTGFGQILTPDSMSGEADGLPWLAMRCSAEEKP